MNEIIRIHLARVAYEIELGAKKELDEYLRAIKTALHNDETLMEVEQRMSEILAEQQVKPGGVITAADIIVIRQQLGEPHDFGDEDASDIPSQPVPKRLMRDMERKQIVGVAAGVSAYFGLDVVVVRLVFILLILVNGFGLLLYLVLWVIMPPARSLSDRLSLRGQTATLEAYKDYSGAVSATTVPSWLLAIGRWVLGIGLLFIGWAPLMVGAVGTATVFTNRFSSFPATGFDWAAIVAAWLGAIAFSVFMTTLGLAALRWDASRIKWPLAISGIVGLLAACAIAATGPLVLNGYRPAQQECHYTPFTHDYVCTPDQKQYDYEVPLNDSSQTRY